MALSRLRLGALVVLAYGFAAQARPEPTATFPYGCSLEVKVYFDASDNALFRGPRRIWWIGPGELLAGHHEDLTSKALYLFLLREEFLPGEEMPRVVLTPYPGTTPQDLIPDPDSGVYDAAGRICRGTIVGSGLSEQLGRLSCIHDGVIDTIIGNSAVIHNPEDLVRWTWSAVSSSRSMTGMIRRPYGGPAMGEPAVCSSPCLLGSEASPWMRTVGSSRERPTGSSGCTTGRGIP